MVQLPVLTFKNTGDKIGHMKMKAYLIIRRIRYGKTHKLAKLEIHGVKQFIRLMIHLDMNLMVSGYIVNLHQGG